ncbi:hypothetical protein ACVR05_06705 [Streptococcus caprae]|uniref:DUF1307 domain-containing protein n=1 Tax=Streptococcus caprae TaxID=1640501 RepID=A0ABV8CW13_9STRE
MKLKSLFKSLLLLPILVLLVACSQSPKDTFISRLKASQTDKAVGYKFDVTVKDIVASDSASQDFSSLKNKTFSFDVNMSEKRDKFGVTMDLSALSEGVSKLDMVLANDTYYMSADAVASYAGLDSSAFEGYYLDGEEYTGQEVFDSSSFSEETKADYSWYKELADDKYTKDDDGNVTLTLTVAELLEVAKENAKATDQEETETYLKLAQAALSDDSKVTITMAEDNSGKMDMDLIFASGVDYGVKSVKLNMTYKQVDYTEPKVPSKDKILTKSQFEEKVMSSYKISDEEFKEIYSMVEGQVANATQEDVQAYIDSISSYLTDEQLKKMEELKAKAGQ